MSLFPEIVYFIAFQLFMAYVRSELRYLFGLSEGTSCYLRRIYITLASLSHLSDASGRYVSRDALILPRFIRPLILLAIVLS